MPAPVRELALRILSRVEREGAYADILLDRTLRDAALADRRDRALLTELVMGTLRRRGALDHAVGPHVPRSLGKTDVVARNALRLGAYQILHMRLPARAAIHATVEAAKALRGERPAGFVNAVLRAVLRHGAPPLPPPDRWDERTAVEFSAPPALVSALARTMGKGEASAFLAASLAKPPFTVRANPFRGGRDALLAAFAAAGADPVPCRYAPDGFHLLKPAPVHSDPVFRAGRYLVMDEGAQLVPPLLAPREGERILDACAAPGGKTSQIAAIASGKARIAAADVSEGRVRLLRATVARTGTPGIDAVVHDFSGGPLPGGAERFDKILVDAPCTGMGVIRRNPDAKWRFTADAPARMAGLQLAILRNAWKSLAAGGLLVYCTCSPLREEDEEVVDRFLAGDGAGDAGLEGPRDWPGPAGAVAPRGFVRLTPQGAGTDGFFMALLRRAKGSVPVSPPA